MVEVKKEGVILKKTDADFESEGVLNPAVIIDNGEIHLFYRAVSKGNYSTIGYCRLSDPLTVAERFDYPVIAPENEYESHGIEDPRIVKIDDTFYISYAAYDGFLALGALAVTHDLKYFTKAGIVVPQVNYKDFRKMVQSSGKVNLKYFRFEQSSLVLWDKNVIFFPRKINNKLVFMHRIKPGIQLISVDSIDDLNDEFWDNYFLDFANNIVLDPACDHETSYIGGGCPPIETEHGWLFIYHSVRDTVNGYIYSASAALLDLNDPRKEIARLPYPLFEPEMDWETKGKVNNVCFPTGSITIEDRLYIYYGAADEQIACASLSQSKLLEELLNQ